MTPYPNPYLFRLTVICGHGGLYPDAKVWQFGETTPDIKGRYAWPVERKANGDLRPVPRHDTRGTRAAGGVGRFRCPICDRNPRPSRAAWHLICVAWRNDGRNTLDISALP